jgi:hypothetical protein
MKLVITCMLAIYVLLLSCIPCQDEAVAASADHSQAITVQQSEGAHSESVDLCSPFCICACCASVTILSVAAVLPETNLARFITSAGFSYLQPVYGGDLRGIWQPPKIVA